MLAVISIHYAPWNWRVLLPSVFGIAGMSLYFVGGQNAPPGEKEDPNYDLYHSLWHLFMSIAGGVVAWTPVDFTEAQQSYGQVYVNLYRNYTRKDQRLLS